MSQQSPVVIDLTNLETLDDDLAKFEHEIRVGMVSDANGFVDLAACARRAGLVEKDHRPTQQD